MIAHRFLLIAFILGLFAPHSAFALDWEIERNFRYFLYPSDMAAQRVARDLYVARKGAIPTPELLENLMNGGGFWRTKLGELGDLRKRWPIDWPRDDSATPYQLVEQLRMQEGRLPLPLSRNSTGAVGPVSLSANVHQHAHTRLPLRDRPRRAGIQFRGCTAAAPYGATTCARPGGLSAYLIPMRTQGNRANGASLARCSPRRIRGSSSTRHSVRFRRERQPSLAIAVRSESSFRPFQPRLRRSLVR